MTSAVGAFARRHQDVPAEVDRDKWKRPLIFPPGTTNPALRMPYTRASTLAGYVDDSFAIHKWEQRHLTRGLGCREDLAMKAAGLPWVGDYDQAKLENPQTMIQLDEIADEAMRYAGRDAKANHGTAMHSFTDPVDGIGDIPKRAMADVTAYKREMEGIEIIMLERFSVCDQLRAAGSFDYVLKLPEFDTWIIADKKTGRYSEHSFAIQTSVYANGCLYDANRPDSDHRLPYDVPLNKEWGLIIWIPKGEGRCELIWIDLVAGYQAARHAAWVRDWHGKQNLSQPYVRGTIPTRAA